MVEPGDKGSERLLTLRLQTSNGPVPLVNAYAPTLTSTPEAKDEFYSNLSDVIRNIPDNEHLVLLGEFNARVGADHDSWSSCLGHFGVGKINENGLSHSTECHGDTHAPSTGIIWIWSLSDEQASRLCCDTDHSLVYSKLRLHPKKFHGTKTAGKPSIDTKKMQCPDKV
ncbi:craniofacial development protein 2-like [Diadema antillarum]|uniref:craniofacial development protein 2-like n=1 Tax=Diadema antillarum TaxID=105358 RepID=UPI003A84F464